MSDQAARIDAFEPDDVVLVQIIAERRLIPPVTRVVAVFLNDKSPEKQLARFTVGFVAPPTGSPTLEWQR